MLVSPPAISELVPILTNQQPLNTEKQSPYEALRNTEHSLQFSPVLNAFDAPVIPLRRVILLTQLIDGNLAPGEHKYLAWPRAPASSRTRICTEVCQHTGFLLRLLHLLPPVQEREVRITLGPPVPGTSPYRREGARSHLPPICPALDQALSWEEASGEAVFTQVPGVTGSP